MAWLRWELWAKPAGDGGWSRGYLQCAIFVTVNLRTKNEVGGKIAVALGSGVTATRHALDVKFGVRIPAPQPEDDLDSKIPGHLILQSAAEFTLLEIRLFAYKYISEVKLRIKVMRAISSKIASGAVSWSSFLQEDQFLIINPRQKKRLLAKESISA